MRILVLNPGSSSLKTSLIDDATEATLATASAGWAAEPERAGERADVVARAIEAVGRDAGLARADVDGVGYRVVHGGAEFRATTLVDDAVVEAIERLDALAPLHNRIAAETIRTGRRILPAARHVAAFDTAFHATLDEAAWRYPIPAEWHRRWGVRRFGFHGLSVTWAVERAARLLERSALELRLVVAHLGAGSSVTAVSGGRSVDTSMGLTPLEGLMMGTRSGSIDLGIVFLLLREGVEPERLADQLEHESGLLGVSGRSADLAELESLAAAGDAAAELAIELYVRRSAAGIAAIATALDRVDGLVFTGGIGEHAAAVRRRICRRLESTLGLESPPATPPPGDAVLVRAPIAIVAVHAREDLVIARQAADLLRGRPADPGAG
jgi:acetate kinase